MPTLLVIDRDDALLPPGWVSAVLTDGHEPTEYERSNRLWRPVIVPDCAELEKQRSADSIRLAARGLICNDGGISEVSDPARVIKKREHAGLPKRKVPGPDRLDRSRSTVWDYGPGRTYSTPQAAFDALLSQEGSDPFTETHYVRGWSGTYGQDASGYVLYVNTVAPSAGHPLVIDVESGESVIWDDEGGDGCLVGSDVSRVRAAGLRMVGGYVGMAPTDNAMVKDWLVRGCEMDGSGGVMSLGVFTYNADRLQIENCRIHDTAGTAVGSSGIYTGDYSNLVAVRGCLLQGYYNAIWSNSELTLVLANNTLVAQNRAITHNGTRPFTLAVMINNVFMPAGSGFNCIHFLDIEPDNAAVLFSDYNCLYPGGGNVAHFPGENLDLSAWQTLYGSDMNSIDSNPMLDSDFVPLQTSPCLRSGATLDPCGFYGKTRTGSVDMGHEQVSDPAVPAITVRRMPEIVRRR